MQLRVSFIISITGFSLLTKSLPFSSSRVAEPQLDRRRLTYSVVPVDGGSQTSTLDVTMVVTVPAPTAHVTRTTVTTVALDEPTSTSTVSTTSTVIWSPQSTDITSQLPPYPIVSTSAIMAPSISSLGTPYIIVESSSRCTSTTYTVGPTFSRPSLSPLRSPTSGSNLTFHVLNTVPNLAQSSTLRLPPLPTPRIY
jgi:hypothetical protein